MATTDTKANDVFKTCTNQVWQLVNQNAKNDKGEFVCQDLTNPCYTITQVDLTLYSYTDLVKRKIIPVYNSSDEAQITNTAKQVAYLTGYSEAQTRAILYWLDKGYKSGTVSKDCLNPISNSKTIIFYGLGVLGLIATGSWLTYNRLKHKSIKKLKGK
jgi:hypothetical protein